MKDENKSYIADFSKFFLNRWRVSILLLIAVSLFGALSYTTLLNRDGFPSVDVPFVSINVDYNVGNRELINDQVTTPIELAIGEIDEVAEVQSFTFDRGSTIVAEFGEGKTSEEGLDLIRDEIDLIALPSQSEVNYQTFDASLIDGEYDIAITLSGDYSIDQLTSKSQEISEELVNLDSVLTAEPLKLTEEQTNIITGETQTVQTNYNRVGLKNDNGEIVFENAIFIGIKKSSDNIDVVTLSADVREELGSLENGLEGYNVSYGLDLADTVNQNIDSLEENALSGLFAVVLIVLVFVNWRASIVTSIFIPVVLLGTFVGLFLLGYTLNVISLFALILVLGLLVDDAIVVVEAIDYQKQKGEKGLRAIYEAIRNIGIADISGTVTTLLVFAPMLFISGILGDFIRLIPVTVILTLIISLVTALSVIPLISNLVIRKVNNKLFESIATIIYFLIVIALFLFATDAADAMLKFGVIALITVGVATAFVGLQSLRKDLNDFRSYLENGLYEFAYGLGLGINGVASGISKVLNTVYRSRVRGIVFSIVVIILSLILIGATSFASSNIKFSIFAPPKDSDVIAGTITFDNVETFSQSEIQALTQDERINLAIETSEEIESIVVKEYGDIIERIGYMMANDTSSVMDVALTKMQNREVKAEEIVANLNDVLANYEGADVKFIVSAAGPPVDDFPFAMQIFANDQETLRTAQNDIANYINGLELGEEMVTEVKTDDLLTLNKIDGRQYAQLKAKFTDNENSALVNELQTSIEEEYGEEELESLGLSEDALGFDFGQESENQESFQGTVFALGVALIVMYGLLVLQYNSYLQPFLVFIAIPLTLPGLIPGLIITNNPFSFFVMLGVIGLTGIVVNNSIMIIDFANQMRAEGLSIGESISEAVARRFRPIITTSATTVAGLIPLAISDPFWEGLAFSIIFGLIASALLIIFVLPSYYVIFENIRGGSKWLIRKGYKPFVE